MKKNVYQVLIGLLVFMTMGVYADTASQWRMPAGKTLSLSYRDTQHVLLAMGQGNQVLVSGKDSYLITAQGGQTMAVNMTEMGGALDMFSSLMMPGAEQMDRFKGAQVRFKKTGRQETIAGFSGDVYQMTVTTQRGVEQHEIVVSNHPDVVALQTIFLELGQRAAKVMPTNQLFETMNYFSRQAEQAHIGGVLRYGNDMVLQRLEKKKLPADAFMLPVGVTQVSLPTFQQ